MYLLILIPPVVNITFKCTDEDNVGPVVLAVMLASAILVNFAVKLYDYAT